MFSPERAAVRLCEISLASWAEQAPTVAFCASAMRFAGRKRSIPVIMFSLPASGSLPDEPPLISLNVNTVVPTTDTSVPAPR